MGAVGEGVAGTGHARLQAGLGGAGHRGADLGDAGRAHALVRAAGLPRRCPGVQVPSVDSTRAACVTPRSGRGRTAARNPGLGVGGRGGRLDAAAARRRKRSTRPPVSISFWRPVSDG